MKTQAELKAQYDRWRSARYAEIDTKIARAIERDNKLNDDETFYKHRALAFATSVGVSDVEGAASLAATLADSFSEIVALFVATLRPAIGDTFHGGDIYSAFWDGADWPTKRVVTRRAFFAEMQRHGFERSRTARGVALVYRGQARRRGSR
ncbi:hypothetical protein [Streptomyces cacaoi]|uniref:hypothetical protein n=1 Tax=Streptomyces cacaoi TaxID=1898 RepID=UPI00260BBBE4|nr:hypothetical protein [Streptomyces cacaoi]